MGIAISHAREIVEISKASVLLDLKPITNALHLINGLLSTNALIINDIYVNMYVNQYMTSKKFPLV